MIKKKKRIYRNLKFGLVSGIRMWVTIMVGMRTVSNKMTIIIL